MVQYHIQQDSEIPASKQLFDQIQFAIASRQYSPGHKLPSTRQLAMETGLHRNTISKVYRQLEETGLVESHAGSGIYVKAQGHEGGNRRQVGILNQFSPEAYKVVQDSLNQLLGQGCSLNQARELFLSEIDWRLRCSARVLVTVESRDIGAGELMVQELEQSLGIPVQLVPMEELSEALDQTHSATVVTSRYFIGKAEGIVAPKSVRVIPVDIYDYEPEIKLIKNLSKGSRLGVVSISSGILKIVEIIIHSLRGDELLVMTAQIKDNYKLKALVRSSQIIISDQASYQTVKEAILAAREDIIRPPKLIRCENYIGSKSINLLKRELGLG
ncbi:MAG: GntR family transcriptional regulator [Moorea sp. SIO1F2]|uniref:GntR family transcriptional regulator n=1 Tax=Moorena bouillonii PNG TaxID=568701 RepID=A0A1U7MXD9_9CYAN|nr:MULTISPECIES: GntR family transcriptional regulator [Moorena]NEN98676.1 GntR family transcriptional regulator [Moorena sp. SIO3I7]NEO06292.1 GntR family transcriptional regulator [Moorena sp. SIO3I8]NEO20310.1 GntR family transcriptional regulator [Moorena sp. SIO4A5]NEP24045.1 GntR family transcriptional regulator [Moorena sp. SIO3I6]NEQ60356.1 GntR family transcriptional regulator [Moorena sp. SIO4A1]